MKWLKVLNLFLLLVFLIGCELTSIQQGNEAETSHPTVKEDDGLPVQWLYFKDNKYVFNRIIPKEEIDMKLIELTGTKTKEGDGVQYGQEIYLYEKDNSLFVIDNWGQTEQWVNFIKND